MRSSAPRAARRCPASRCSASMQRPARCPATRAPSMPTACWSRAAGRRSSIWPARPAPGPNGTPSCRPSCRRSRRRTGSAPAPSTAASPRPKRSRKATPPASPQPARRRRRSICPTCRRPGSIRAGAGLRDPGQGQGLRRFPARRHSRGRSPRPSRRLRLGRASEALHHARHGDRPGQDLQRARPRHHGRLRSASRSPKSARRVSARPSRRCRSARSPPSATAS